MPQRQGRPWQGCPRRQVLQRVLPQHVRGRAQVVPGRLDLPAQEDLGLVMTATDPTTPLLEVRGLTLRLGCATALSNVSFDVHPAELFAILGPNGAGTPSHLTCLSATYRPQAGPIPLAADDLPGTQRARAPRRGK